MEPETALLQVKECFDSSPLWAESLVSQQNRLVLIARSPRSVLAYWEWTGPKADVFRKGAFAPEVVFVLLRAATGAEVFQEKRRWDDLRFYFTPPAGGTYYRAALLVSSAAGQPHSKLESNSVYVPRGAAQPPDGGCAS